MLALSFVHFQQPWPLLSWIHIYYWRTFVVVLLLGVFQSLIAWDGGYLAIRGTEDKLPKTRNLHILAFALLGIGLLLMTALVGVLNDHDQHQAEQRAIHAEEREAKLQTTLDQQSQLIVKADSDLAKVRDTVQSGGAVEKVGSQLTLIQQTLSKAMGLQVSPNRQESSTNMPFANMSDSELKDAVMKFDQKMRSDNIQMYQVQDKITATRGRMMQQRLSPTPDQVDLLSEQNNELNMVMKQIIQEDVPMATQYNSELFRRLGLNPKSHRQIQPPTANIASIDGFLVASGASLDELAYKLSKSGKSK